MNKINGIDVSECEKLGETIDGFTCGLGKRIRFANEIITKHNLCKDNPNCYYKQLKRLQQELDIKEKMLDKFMIGSGETLEKLQQENEESKEKAIKYTEENGNLIIQRNTIENKLRDTENRLISLQKANLHNLVLLKRYKQALVEIRDFSENFCGEKCPFYKNEYSEVCNEACILDNIVNPILKRINEVLNVENN